MAKQPSAGGGGGKGSLALLIAICSLPLLYMLLPTMILLFFTMLPTGAAFFLERKTERYAWITVGGLNFAGVAPSLIELWFGGQRMDQVWKIMSLATLIVSYGSAAFGWLLFMAVPPLVGVFLTLSAGHNVTRLRARQRQLVDHWGPEVAQNEEMLAALKASGRRDAEGEAETEKD